MLHRLRTALVRSLLVLVPVATMGCESDPTSTPQTAFNVAADNGVVASVRGSGHIRRADGTYRVFTLNAVRLADGQVSGRYNLENPGPESPLRVKGNITCFVVDGNSAYIAGDVDRFDANPFPSFPGGMAVEIIDNGQGVGAAPDLVSPLFFTETQQEVLDYCADPAPGPVLTVLNGNFEVR